MAFLSVAEAKDKLSVVLPIDDLEARALPGPLPD